METIDYPTRKDLVDALLDFRKRGIRADVVHHGRTLAFPDGIGATEEDVTPVVEPDGIEHEAPADGVKKTPVEGDTLLGVTTPEDEPMDRSTFTVEGTCSECGEAALAEPDGTWIHEGAATHGDTDGTFVPNEEKDEDLIGDVQEPKKRTRKSQ